MPSYLDMKTRMITTIDAHVAGNVVRLLTGGLPAAQGASLAERARWLERRHAPLCDALTRQPRGHEGLVLGVLGEPAGDADASLLLRRGRAFIPLAGHAVIAAATLALPCGLLRPPHRDVLRIDTAAGPIDVQLDSLDARRAAYVAPPAFVLAGGLAVAAGPRSLPVDIAWSGQFFAIVDSEAAGLPLARTHHTELRRAARSIAEAVSATVTLAHPAFTTSETLGGVLFTGPPTTGAAHLRALAVSPDGITVPGPLAEAVVASLAVLDAMGIAGEDAFVLEGLSGTTLSGRIVERSRVGPLDAVSVRIDATAWPIGEHRFIVHADDPLRAGFDW
jgi:proline racemase